MKKHLDKFSISHNELWDKINIPVSVVSILFWWSLSRSELSIKISEIKRSSLSSIILISIKVQNLFALGGEEA